MANKFLLVIVLGTCLVGCALAMRPVTDEAILASGKESCGDQKRARDCDDLSTCTWCTSTLQKKGSCYTVDVAKYLPKQIFTCDETDLQINDTCDNRSEGDCSAPDCVWCTSAAVGGGCYSPDQAKKLPAAIFKCKTAPAADLLA